MESFDLIAHYLDGVRRTLARNNRLFWTVALSGAALWLVLLGVCAASSLGEPHARALHYLVLGALAAAVAGSAVGLWHLRRRYAGSRALARYVGEQKPAVASDLLSAVELGDELAAGEPRFSRDLAYAFARTTAARLEDFDPPGWFSRRARFGAALSLALAVCALFVGLWVAPAWLGTGWQRLVHPPGSADGRFSAIEVQEPLVGDLRVTLAFPAYMKRAPLVAANSTGDIFAPRGTVVSMEMIALKPALEVELVLADEVLATQRSGDTFHAEFTIASTNRAEGAPARGPASPGRDAWAANTYRFAITTPVGERLLEAQARSIDIEPDLAPNVELVAPADELDVASTRSIELGYRVKDDHGLKEVALVWRDPEGEREQRLVFAARPAAGATPPASADAGTSSGAPASETAISQPVALGEEPSAAGTYVWDLAEVPLRPGVRIAYHLEALDNDDVAGPNVGSSRTFYLKVYNPRERHEALFDRQARVFELAVQDLGERLLLHERRPTPDLDLPGWRQALRRTQLMISELGLLLGELDEDRFAPKKLKPALQALRKELAAALGPHERLLTERSGAPWRPRELDELHNAGARLANQLEDGVIELQSWLDRQRLEDILAISDEIKAHRERLAKLVAQYERNGSAELRAEIEREIRALERALAELEARLAKLSGEVGDRFVNPEAMPTDTSCLQKARQLLDQDRVREARAELAKCQKQMDAQQKSLEQALRELRGDKFSAEEKALSELMDRVGDLADAQNKLSQQAQDLLDAYRRKAAAAARDRNNLHREAARKVLEELRRKVDDVPGSAVSEFGRDELALIKTRLGDVKKMIDEGDLAEALSMAQEAEASLRTLEADIDDDLADGKPLSEETPKAFGDVQKAVTLGDTLIDELERATPSPSQIMSAEDRAGLDRLRQRQDQIRERTDKLAQKATGDSDKLPGEAGQQAREKLGEASEQMGHAGERFSARDPMGAHEQARGAAETLEKLRQALPPASRPAARRGGMSQEPIKIPGREEYRPSEWFRERLLDAMKEKAPEKFEEQVRRYYKELAK